MRNADSSLESRRMARWQALTLLLLVCGYAGYYLCRSNLSVAMPLIAAELTRKGLSPEAARIALGSLASLGVFAYALGKFPSGSLADLLGGRRNFLIGMAGSVVCTLLFAATGTLPLFTIAWGGNRLVQSLGWAGAVQITAKWFPFRRYGTVMAIVSLSFLFGDAVCREFMALLIGQGLGWRGVFCVAAAVLAGLLAVCAWLLKESPRELGMPEPEVNPANVFAEAAEGPSRLRDLLMPLVRNRTFWIVCALSFGTTILKETFNLWTPTYFTQAVGMTASEAASRSALFPLFGGVSVLLCGWLSDRLGGTGRAALLFGGLALAGVVLLLPGLGAVQHSPVWPVVIVAAIAFLTTGPYSFLAGAISLDFGGRRGSGTASGLIDGIGYLGGILAGDTVARVSVMFGWSGAFRALAVVAFLSSLAAALFLMRVSGGPKPAQERAMDAAV